MFNVVIVLMELSSSQLSHLMRRFPEFELSYETISHNKVSDLYDVCLAIPTGRKCCAWFTFHEDKNVCYLFDLNREKKISKGRIVPVAFNPSLSLGTVVYGTIWSSSCFSEKEPLKENDKPYFIIEDILHFEGITMKSSLFGERIGFLQQFMSKLVIKFDTNNTMVFALPLCWKVELEAHCTNDINNKIWNYPDNIPANIIKTIAYPVHHIQYRSLKEVMPYLNVNIQRKINTSVPQPQKTAYLQKDMVDRIDLSKPQYKCKTVFQVSADLQFDIYHLYAYGKNNQIVYYNVAYIPSYKTSVFMNGLFRKIRENKNLDYIEESDDEADFQDTEYDKYVDTKKVLLMECVFNNKFKKWVPIRVMDKKSKVVHIYKLIR
jgi:hypothetical protein